MKDEFAQRRLRAIRYDYVDGTPDLAFGGLCLVMAICFFILAAFPRLSSSSFSVIIVWVVFSGGGLLIAWMSQGLKEKVTFPRTGYVKPRGRPLKRATMLLIRIGAPIVIVILLVLMFLIRQKVPAQVQEPTISLNPGLMGFLISGIFAFIGWKIVLPRYYLIAASVFLISTVFLVIGPVGTIGLATLSWAMSLVLFASGCVTLWKYLRQNPAPQVESDEL